MSKARREKRLQQWFDGESPDPEAMERLIGEDADASALVDEWRHQREAVQSVIARQEIADPQFPAFMEGIREGIQPRRRSHRGMWALASLTAASLIVALSAFLVLNLLVHDGQHQPVSADVEEVSSDIPGAEVGYDIPNEGAPTVWVEESEGDL